VSHTPVVGWHEANQSHLSAALAVVRAALERHAGDGPAESEVPEGARRAVREASEAMPVPAALETLCETFGLTPFERDVMLLCAGMELDSGFAALCASAQGDPRRAYPTFGLALAALPGAHWSALTPAAPLRHWRLVEVGTGDTLTSSPLRVDERALHHLAGTPYLDERLVGVVDPVPLSPSGLVPSQRALAERIAAAWDQASGALPVVQLCGDEAAGKRAICAAACYELGLNLSAMLVNTIPPGPDELEALLRLWEREAALSASALLLDCDELDSSDPARASAVARLIECANYPLVVASRERRQTPRRTVITLDVRKPTIREQRALWDAALTDAGFNGHVETLVSQFSLGAHAIRAASAEVLAARERDHDLAGIVWDACRVQARPRLDELAQRIEPAAAWDELVLPGPQLETLREISAHVRQRSKVYETWGFAAKGARGLGIGALFSGASGTGKTMAAEVLAGELRLDLYRIDLSQVVSKYIGETEKNLRRVFDAAEEGGAVLLFDEADALFGKRSEVKDSHDRYANIEVSYLLQRMESYRGLAILTTNMKNALDAAFLRRIRFIVSFPFPDAEQRAEIWRRIFPPSTPTEGLDVDKLARLNVAGGNIRNIALNAAFLAADAGQPVCMSHLLRGARGEYAKLEKPLTDAEIGGWV
jgi:ATPase family associated with various cellular activities (AAA)